MKTTKPWHINQIDQQLIELAFAEDLGVPYFDATTQALFPEKTGISSAMIISKHPKTCTVSGLPVVEALLKQFENCELETNFQDGDRLDPGSVLMTLRGPAHFLLMSERTILNFLQRLCAIASLTAEFVDKIKHTTCQVLDTRKTLPGFRHLDKYAVHCGGGINHRMGLYDAIMVKDTHIDLLGGMQAALHALPSSSLPIIIEVRSLEELSIVLEQAKQKVTRVLLDNMTIPLMKECVKLSKGILPTEASGSINLDNVAAIAETGVDFVSVGKLTHSAGNIDLSMKCDIRYA